MVSSGDRTQDHIGVNDVYGIIQNKFGEYFPARVRYYYY